MNRFRVFVVIVMGVLAATTSHAQYIEIDLGTNVNADLRTALNASNYQMGGSQLNVAGVPFQLALFNNTPGTTGVVYPPTNGQTNTYTISVPPSIHAVALYTLIDNAWGVCGIDQGNIIVMGTAGETATMNLAEGSNTRDYNNDGFCNALTDGTVVPTYFVNQVPNSTSGQVRMDRQVLVLPPTFAGDTIASIRFNSIGQGSPNGSPWVAAMTLLTSTTNFQITSITVIGTNVMVSWAAPTGSTNTLQATAGGIGGSYNTNGLTGIFTVTNLIGTATNYLDVGAATNTPARYYRVRLVQ